MSVLEVHIADFNSKSSGKKVVTLRSFKKFL